MKYKYKIGFIGCGNMAKAIINGLISSNFIAKDSMLLSSPSLGKDYLGISCCNDNKQVLRDCEYVFLAIKPQVFNAIQDEFVGNNAKCIVSIMAGVNTAKLKSVTNSNEIIRIMPNTPCSIGFGVSAITSLDASTESIEFIDKIFKTISSTLFVEEKYFDAVTSISGSGPAYVYYFIKSMIDAGVDGGLSFEQSKMLTLQTFIGASKMVEKSDEDLAVLINKVCSKGGTTIQAIDTFNNNNLDKIILDGIQKCRKRSEELSK